MVIIDKNAPVMVTGATGYVAGWLVKKLLDEGYTVHAAVRNPEAKEELTNLNKIADNSPGKIKYFKTDLLEDGSYKEAMQDCQLVFHTASPFIINVQDPQKELIEPAQLGTRNVLEQANQTLSVRRVVLTSSCAAIYGDNIDLAKTAKGVFTEKDWNTTSSLKHRPYSYSKTIAEKEAWKIYDNQKRWDLVVINPSFVIGPAINPYKRAESIEIFKKLGDGTLKNGTAIWGMGVVDSRDLAEAHFNAGMLSNAKGRYIVCAKNTDFIEMSQYLIDKYNGDYPFPKKSVSKLIAWLFAPYFYKSMTRKLVYRNVNHPWRIDNSKSIKELGVKYRPISESITDFFQQMIDCGII